MFVGAGTRYLSYYDFFPIEFIMTCMLWNLSFFLMPVPSEDNGDTSFKLALAVLERPLRLKS
jgi:hypothetical protein